MTNREIKEDWEERLNDLAAQFPSINQCVGIVTEFARQEIQNARQEEGRVAREIMKMIKEAEPFIIGDPVEGQEHKLLRVDSLVAWIMEKYLPNDARD